jgi:hypothetical protein
VYFGHWTPDFRRLEKYEGRVTAAAIGKEAIPGVLLLNSSAVRSMILQNAKIQVTGIAGLAPSGLAPVLSVTDESHQMFLVGIDREDLVYHYRSRSAGLGLGGIQLRAPGLASELRSGGPLQILVQPEHAGVRFGVNGRDETVAQPTLAMGWRFLFGFQALQGWLGRLFDYSWLIFMIAGIGYWARHTLILGVLTALFAFLLLFLPHVSWLAPTPLSQFLVLPPGALLGWVTGRLLPPGGSRGSQLIAASRSG